MRLGRLPVIILFEDIQGCCICHYVRRLEPQREKRMCLGSPRWPTIQFIKMMKDLKFVLKQQRFLQSNTFFFWYWTETFKHHEKLNSWGQEKCLAPPLNLNSPVWIFSSSPISNLISKSVELVLKMGLGDDTIVVTRE